MRKALGVFVMSLSVVCGCRDNEATVQPSTTTFPRNTPQELNYQNISVLLQDMKAFAVGVRALNQRMLQAIDAKYKDVTFKIDQQPLFINVYPDPATKAVIFLLMPKDPRTGSNYLLTFEKKVPVADSDTIEIQIRTENPEQPFQCKLQVSDPSAYMKERENHKYSVMYTLRKAFLQSGTYDFDALTYPSYRTKGFPFIVFDFVSAELKDTTLRRTTSCK